VRALVVVPTRELAQQIVREFRRMAGTRAFRFAVLTKAAAATAHGQGPSAYKLGRNTHTHNCGAQRVLTAKGGGAVGVG
jgi:hypothetical protein